MPLAKFGRNWHAWGAQSAANRAIFRLRAAPSVAFVHHLSRIALYRRSPSLISGHRAYYLKMAFADLIKGERTMQGFKGVLAVATIVGVSAALGACGLHFPHHQKQVVHEPLKLGSAEMIVEQPERR